MANPHPNRQLPRILLIDDDAISREVLGMMLEMQGFPVDSAEDGSQALDLLAQVEFLPNIILMDTQMPGLSGVPLVQALRQLCRPGDTRIFAISGSDVSEEIRQAADGFLLKPIQIESLVALFDDQANASEAPTAQAPAEAGAEIPDIVDPIVLGKLKAMMSAAALTETYDAVASDLESRLASLSAAMEACDAAEVARIAHTIKGGCSMVGLSMAKDAATRLETSNRCETWPKELSRLHFALGALKRILGNGLL